MQQCAHSRSLAVLLTLCLGAGATAQSSEPSNPFQKWPSLASQSRTVIAVTTPSGELEISVAPGQVTATLDGVAIPSERITSGGCIRCGATGTLNTAGSQGETIRVTCLRCQGLKGPTVTIAGDDGRTLARIDTAPQANWGTAQNLLRKQKHMRIGVQLKEPEEALAAQLEIDPAEAVMIVDVTVGKPAAEAGLREFDVITAIAGSTPATQEKLQEHLDGMKAGESVKLRILRGGQSRDVTVTPEMVEEPASSGWDAYGLLNRVQRAQGNQAATLYQDPLGGYVVDDKWRRGLYDYVKAQKWFSDATQPAGDLLQRLERLEEQLKRVEALLESHEKKGR